ncbi:hypothetical protein [Streptomyces canus]|uniref:hypothetical protein n=1 Tax=Streptomyces canus TaxID=58343 RepID=UPI0033B0EF16
MLLHSPVPAEPRKRPNTLHRFRVSGLAGHPAERSSTSSGGPAEPVLAGGGRRAAGGGRRAAGGGRRAAPTSWPRRSTLFAGFAAAQLPTMPLDQRVLTASPWLVTVSFR